MPRAKERQDCYGVGWWNWGCTAIFVSSLLLLMVSVQAKDDDRGGLSLCGGSNGIQALGMESGAIPDSAITVSSSHDYENVGPLSARLNKEHKAGAWCPSAVYSTSEQWIQVNFSDLNRPDDYFVITGIATAGRFANSQGKEYTEFISINYTRDGDTWHRWLDPEGNAELVGNQDTYTVKENILSTPIVRVQSIRIIPVRAQESFVCLRFELYGCPYRANAPISYSMISPEGFTPFGEMRDESYDGYLTSNGTWLEGGLGQLVDGIEGDNDLRDEVNKFDWIAWKANEALIFQFEFEAIQNFTSATFHAHHMLSRDISVFKMAHIWFSLDGFKWSHTPEEFETYEMADRRLERARNVTINLHHRIGRFIKFHFQLSSKWLLLSEVHFESKTVTRLLTRHELDYFKMPATKQLDQQQLVIIIVSVVALFLVIIVFVVFLLTRKPKPKNKIELEYASIPIKTTFRGSVLPYGERYCLNQVPTVFSAPNDNDYAVPDAIETDDNAVNCNTRSLLQWSPAQCGGDYENDDDDDGKAKYYASIDVLAQTLPPPTREYSPTHGPLDSNTNNDLRYHRQASPQTISMIVNVALRNSIPILSQTDVSVVDGQFGYSKFSDCELGLLHDGSTQVVLKSLSDLQFEKEFAQEMLERWRLSSQCHASFALFHGCITKHDYLAIVFEFGDMDLKKFLQTCPAAMMNTAMLMQIAYQISQAMQDLHSKGFVHRDLAARNCLIYTSSLKVKVTDVGACMQAYKKEYFNEILPIRWMSFESIVNSEFTNKSDVYNFGVTLWEIMSLCQELPHAKYTDEQLIDIVFALKNNLEVNNRPGSKTSTFYHQPFDDNNELTLKMVQLAKPVNCSNDVYNLMLKCCQLDERSRPEFHDISYLINKKLNL